MAQAPSRKVPEKEQDPDGGSGSCSSVWPDREEGTDRPRLFGVALVSASAAWPLRPARSPRSGRPPGRNSTCDGCGGPLLQSPRKSSGGPHRWRAPNVRTDPHRVDATIVPGLDRTFGGGPSQELHNKDLDRPTLPTADNGDRTVGRLSATYSDAATHRSRYPARVPTGLQVCYIDAYARATYARVAANDAVEGRINKRIRMMLMDG